MGIDIFSILVNISGFDFTFIILKDFFVFLYWKYKNNPANIPPAVAPKEAAPAENSIPFCNKIYANPTPKTTLPICSSICDIADGVIFWNPWKKPLKTVTNDIIIGAKEIPINE